MIRKTSTHLAIARAQAMRPKAMLLDEVASALDPEVIGEVLNVIRSLNDEHNLTMLMETHQMGFARKMNAPSSFYAQCLMPDNFASAWLFARCFLKNKEKGQS